MQIIDKGLITSFLTHQCFTCYLSSLYWFAFIFKSILKVEVKLKNDTFKIINNLTNSAIPLKITFTNLDKKAIIISAYSYFIC